MADRSQSDGVVVAFPRSAAPAKPSHLDAALGAAIRSCRQRRRLTASGLAARADAAEHQIVHLEQGDARISPLLLVRIARALGTTPMELLRAADSALSPRTG